MKPPAMRPWNLALRFVLEIGALTGLGTAAWSQTVGISRWIAVALAPLAAAAMWGTFNVIDDPSRSGEAPVEVSGRVRLGVEMLVLGGGWISYVGAGYVAVGVSFGALTILHYVVSRPRVHWLLAQATIA